MPAITRQEASLLPAAAAVTLANADARGFIPVGQTCGCGAPTTCNAYGACHRGSAAGMAILYAAGVSMPGVYPMQRSCPWRRTQTAVPVAPVPAEPAAAIVLQP